MVHGNSCHTGHGSSDEASPGTDGQTLGSWEPAEGTPLKLKWLWRFEYRTRMIFEMVESCSIAKWSGFLMTFEYQTTKLSMVFRPPFQYTTCIGMVVWILDHFLNIGHLNTQQVKVCYSDVHYSNLFSRVKIWSRLCRISQWYLKIADIINAQFNSMKASLWGLFRT